MVCLLRNELQRVVRSNQGIDAARPIFVRSPFWGCCHLIAAFGTCISISVLPGLQIGQECLRRQELYSDLDVIEMSAEKIMGAWALNARIRADIALIQRTLQRVTRGSDDAATETFVA